MTESGTSLRVALCAPGELWGGVEQFVATLARHYHRTGTPVVVAALFDGPLREQLANTGVPITVVSGTGRYDPRAVLRLKQVLRDHHINVVHTNGYRAAVIGSLAAWAHGACHVRTEHGRVEPWRGRARIKMELNAAAEYMCSRFMTDATIFVSHDIRRHSRLSNLDSGEVIYNGIDTAAESPIDARDRLDSNRFHIGIVGRIAPIKGHRILLSAVEQLSDLPDLQVHVLGSGPLEAECQDYCRDRGLSERVIFHGFRRNVHDYLQQFDLLAMPSFHEGLPYTLLEAMQSGVPVLASNVGGLAEIIQDGVSGLLVPAGDASALATAIRKLHGDPALRQALANRAMELASSKFTVDHMARAYLLAYERALGSRNASARPAHRPQTRESRTET